jgi:hypothetical protein
MALRTIIGGILPQCGSDSVGPVQKHNPGRLLHLGGLHTGANVHHPATIAT